MMTSSIVSIIDMDVACFKTRFVLCAIMVVQAVTYGHGRSMACGSEWHVVFIVMNCHSSDRGNDFSWSYGFVQCNLPTRDATQTAHTLTRTKASCAQVMKIFVPFEFEATA